MENYQVLKAFGLAVERFIYMETIPLDPGEYMHPHGISIYIANYYGKREMYGEICNAILENQKYRWGFYKNHPRDLKPGFISGLEFCFDNLNMAKELLGMRKDAIDWFVFKSESSQTIDPTSIDSVGYDINYGFDLCHFLVSDIWRIEWVVICAFGFIKRDDPIGPAWEPEIIEPRLKSNIPKLRGMSQFNKISNKLPEQV